MYNELHNKAADSDYDIQNPAAVKYCNTKTDDDNETESNNRDKQEKK